MAMSQYLVLLPVVLLFALGLFITLQSGPLGTKSVRGLRVVAENFWAMMIRVFCYLAGLLMLQEILRTPSFITLGW